MEALKLGKRITHQRLSRMCFIDYDRELALVAEKKTEKNESEILGVSRMSRLRASRVAEFTIVISDRWQGLGLGTALMEALIATAREEGIERLSSKLLPGNDPMQGLCSKLGFSIEPEPSGPMLDVVLELS